MIKEIKRKDTEAILKLAKKLGMFEPQELSHVNNSLENFFRGNDELWFAIGDDEISAVIYCAPEAMTHGAWNVLMLLVDPDQQSKGNGRALMRHIEEVLITRGQRLLLVETSSLDAFSIAQSFYRKCGFEEEARIRDFYADGDDKIVFRKLLSVKFSG